MLIPMVAVLRVPMAIVLEVEVVSMSDRLVAARLLDMNVAVIALMLGTGARFHAAPPKFERPHSACHGWVSRGASNGSVPAVARSMFVVPLE